jgi:hypothetical protein
MSGNRFKIPLNPPFSKGEEVWGKPFYNGEIYFPLTLTLSFQGREHINNDSNSFLSLGRKGGQASSEGLLPLGYGERDRIKVGVKLDKADVVN